METQVFQNYPEKVGIWSRGIPDPKLIDLSSFTSGGFGYETHRFAWISAGIVK